MLQKKNTTGCGFSCALMWLGEFDQDKINKKECLPVYAMHLYENESLVDLNSSEILDRSSYYNEPKKAWTDALLLAKNKNYFVVNEKFNS